MPESPENRAGQETETPAEVVASEAGTEQQPSTPVLETETSVSYLGVELKKTDGEKSQFVPDREHYKDYINDQFSIELQQKLAISFKQGEPMLLEGGTSIGKTTTVRKMAAELGWEVHYVNLNGASDVEDLMGRYIPNSHRERIDDPEYVFADGKVTSGLRLEEGKQKVVILDELNAAAPNILIRLHEVLDALERNSEVVLSEDASESVGVSKEQTKVVGLMNPPGKGYFAREPLDPAQLRRWNYQKEVNALPDQTFSHATDVLFGLAESTDTEATPKESYLTTRDQRLLPEQLGEIPGIQEVLGKYKEFHKAAKELVHNRSVAADQPQKFTYDDRMEPRRVKEFVQQFYSGDINETFQKALQYYYSNKLESRTDKQKLDELIRHVAYIPQEASQRRALEDQVAEVGTVLETDTAFVPGTPEVKIEGPLMEQLEKAREILGEVNVLGPAEVMAAFGIELDTKTVPEIPYSREELERAKELGQFLVYRTEKDVHGKVLTMQAMEEQLKPIFDKSASGKVLYDTSWYEKEDFFVKDASRTGWALTTRELVPNSESKDYVQQTSRLAEYLEKDIFKGRAMPIEYKRAIEEFRREEKDLTKLVDKDWQEAAKRLSSLSLNKMTRQKPIETMWDTMAYFQNSKERLLENRWTWSPTLSSEGRLVYAGDFDSEGLDVGSGRPGGSLSDLGVSFSRNQ